MLSSAFLLLVSNVFLSLRLGSGVQGAFPRPLSAEEEAKNLTLWIEDGSTEARNKLIEHNLRLVAHIVKKYYSQLSDVDDLISIGTIGLIKGVSSYKPDKNVRLATYASRCIENEILMYFRSQRKLSQEISINDTIDTDRDGNALTYEDIIKIDDTIADDLDAKIKLSKAAKFIMKELDERERQIITLRYGISGNNPKTQREVAKILGISRSYVSRIEKSALDKIRNAL